MLICPTGHKIGKRTIYLYNPLLVQSMKYKYTEQQLRDAISKSLSMRQVLLNLNIVGAGGNYSTTKKHINTLQIDTSHFTGQAWNKGQYHGPQRPIEDYLTNKAQMNSNCLKKRLIKEGIFLHQCMNCKLTEWLGNLIPLELHHIDGNHDNSFKENLQLLCPNCHTLTDNYRSRKLKIQKPPKLPKVKKITIPKITDPNWRTKDKPDKRKVERPTKEQLSDLIQGLPVTRIAKLYEVSDNCIKKWAKRYQIL